MSEEKVSALNTVPRPKEWDKDRKGAVWATSKQIVEHLQDLEIIFPDKGLTKQQMERRREIYCLDLGQLTELELRAACERYRKHPESEYFPTPGQLLALAHRW
jgi:hypothetical protein